MGRLNHSYFVDLSKALRKKTYAPSPFRPMVFCFSGEEGGGGSKTTALPRLPVGAYGTEYRDGTLGSAEPEFKARKRWHCATSRVHCILVYRQDTCSPKMNSYGGIDERYLPTQHSPESLFKHNEPVWCRAA